MKIKAIITGFTLLLSLYSCGGGNTEGELDSVIIYASVDPSEVQADIVKKDTNNDGTSDVFYISPVQINLTINVISNPNLPANISPSPVKVEKLRMFFSPVSQNAIPLESTEKPLTSIINPDTQQTITVSVGNTEPNNNLISLINTPAIYTAQIYITVKEIYSGNSKEVKVTMSFSVGDFITTDENCTPP